MLTVPGGKSFQNRQLIRLILELQAIAWRTSAQNVFMHPTTAEHCDDILLYTPTWLITSCFPLTLHFLLIFAVNSYQHSFKLPQTMTHYLFNTQICYIVNFKCVAAEDYKAHWSWLECCQPCSQLPCGDISVSCGMIIDRLVPCGIVLPWDYIVTKDLYPYISYARNCNHSEKLRQCYNFTQTISGIATDGNYG